jgi:polysaccharide pyruvyl transferase WcaK-like protein
MAVFERSKQRRIVLLGATITGNRGAESMLRAAVQHIPEHAGPVRFTLLSLYPEDDRKENREPSLEIVSCTPLQLVACVFPLTCLGSLFKRLGLPFRFLPVSPAVRALMEADLVVDLSGISFVDGRGPGILLYNVLVVLLPWMWGIPIVKYSQALGPFKNPLNRFCARWMLPKAAHIAARGRITREHLAQLAIPQDRIGLCADAAFAMRIGPSAEQEAAKLMEHPIFSRPVIAVSPSSVVDRLCGKLGIDYPAQMAAFVKQLIERTNYNVVILPHSARPGRESLKNNDLPVCSRLVETIGHADRRLYLDQAYSAETLRALIGRSRILIASRFHAMISGLAMGTPTLLVGWSHKYAEVLESFGLTDYALDYSRVSQESLSDLFGRIDREQEQIREMIRKHLPAVIDSSIENARIVGRLLKTRSGQESPARE